MSEQWVYWQSEPSLWTVGYYTPDGTRELESDHGKAEDAAQRVHYLNGGINAELLAVVKVAKFIISRNAGLKLPRSEAMTFLSDARDAIAKAEP